MNKIEVNKAAVLSSMQRNGQKLKVLELFCGTKSISKAFQEKGHETFTVDMDIRHNPDLCIDILKFTLDCLPPKWRNPDVVWASPPCNTFSRITVDRYWENDNPKTWKTYVGLATAKKTVEIIKQINPRYWFIENPHAQLQKQWFMKQLPKKEVCYCKYGYRFRKQTDIWTNASHWTPKPTCHPRDNCHTGNLLRDSTGWTFEDQKNRYRIPETLSKEIVAVVERKVTVVNCLRG